MTAVNPLVEIECDCQPDPADLPVALLTATIDEPALFPPLLAVTVDYEAGSWRADALAGHVLEWVLDFAMLKRERDALSAGRAIAAARRAVRIAFGNGNDRGVPGEIMLHAVCRQFFGSDTIINKVWFKTSDNDTYKGFDAVHCVHTNNELELWLGEAKFYKNLPAAIRSALSDLEDHTARDYLRAELAIVAEKIDDTHPHASELRTLMHPNTSLDAVFKRIVIPVLIAYDSKATQDHQSVCDEYREALEAEVRRAWIRFKSGIDTNLPVAVRLFLVPMATKKDFQQALKSELEAWH
jgi:hypothetical protein